MLLLCVWVLLLTVSVDAAGVFEWTLQTSSAPWPARHAGGVECWPTRLTFNDMQGVERTVTAGGVDMTGCPLVLWGGENRRAGTVLQDVWVSTNAGRRPAHSRAPPAHLAPLLSPLMSLCVVLCCSWSFQSDGLYPGATNAGYTVSSRGVMVAVGGSFERGIVTAADLFDFNAQQVRDPGWDARSYAQVQYNTRGDLYMAGGYFPVRADVWRSVRESCCSDWDRLSDLPAPRGAGALLFLSGAASLADNSQDRLLYFGGITDGRAVNDVFLTVDSASSWVTMPTAPWGPRWNLNAEVTKDGLIVMAGGIYDVPGNLKDRNDVWLSPDGGFSWVECAQSERQHWADREWLMTAVDSKGFLYVMGGNDWDTDSPSNDVWRTRLSLHDTEALQDACGLPALRSGCPSYGLLCLPPTVPGGESTTIVTTANNSHLVYCDACPGPSEAGPGNPQAVAAAIVFGLMFAAAAVISLWLYCKGRDAGYLRLFSFDSSTSSDSQGLAQPLTDSVKSSSDSRYDKL